MLLLLFVEFFLAEMQSKQADVLNKICQFGERLSATSYLPFFSSLGSPDGGIYDSMMSDVLLQTQRGRHDHILKVNTFFDMWVGLVAILKKLIKVVEKLPWSGLWGAPYLYNGNFYDI